MREILREYVKGTKAEEVSKRKVFWSDVETTGLDKFKNSIISIGIIISVDGVEYEKNYFTCIPYGFEVNEKALEVNDMSISAILTHEYNSRTLYKEIQGIIEKYVDRYDLADKFYLGGFNCDFDKGFLSSLWQLNCWEESKGKNYFGSYFHGGTIDVLAIANFLYSVGKLDSLGQRHTLAELAKFFNITVDGNMHNSLTDIEVTKKIYELCESKISVAKGEVNNEI